MEDKLNFNVILPKSTARLMVFKGILIVIAGFALGQSVAKSNREDYERFQVLGPEEREYEYQEFERSKLDKPTSVPSMAFFTAVALLIVFGAYELASRFADRYLGRFLPAIGMDSGPRPPRLPEDRGDPRPPRFPEDRGYPPSE